MLSSNNIVEIKDIHKAFGKNEVLKGISLSVPKGKAIAIIGPSGSGKSTVLRCINGLIKVDRGEIVAAGHAVHSLNTDAGRIALRKDVCMVFQQYNLFPHLTVLDNVMLAPLRVLKQDRTEVEDRARSFLAKVRLAGKEAAFPGELSGGQQQRVAIARALAMRPTVMLFDEVTAALDPETVKEVLTTIRELVEEGMTSLLVTHEMRFAREIASHIFFTDHGRIVEHGAPEELFDSPTDPRTKEFLSHVL